MNFVDLAIATWKEVLKRLCVFIDTQLHRSPRDHTREMHSTCVATYNTLMTIIIERPTLLEDQENLFRLCEIIELGVSGEKAEVRSIFLSSPINEIHFSPLRKLFTKKRKIIVQHLNVLLKPQNI